MKANNKRVIYMTLLLLVITYTSISCNNKDSYINSFKSFVNETKLNADTYTAEDWEASELRYEKYAINDYQKYREELTEEEKELIGKLKASYQLQQLKREGENFIEDFKDALYQIKGVLEEVGDTSFFE